MAGKVRRTDQAMAGRPVAPATGAERGNGIADASKADLPLPRRFRRPAAGAVLRENWIIVILAVLVMIFGLESSSFFSQSNWLNVTNTALDVTILAVAQTALIISGGIDLSQSAVLGLSGVLAAWVALHGFGGATAAHPLLATVAGFAVAIAVGAFVGLVNGVVIVTSKLNPFIVTLGTLEVCTGIANLLSGGQDMTSLPSQFASFGNLDLFGWIPLPVLAAAVFCILLAVAMKKTRWGRYTYVIGDSRDAALRGGLRVDRHMVGIYVLSGTAAGLAGVLLMSHLADGAPQPDVSVLLDAIAAAVIGGASLSGGRGSIGRTVVGALIITVLLIGLVILNVQAFWQDVAVGVVLVVAVLIDQRGQLRSKLGTALG